MALTGCGVPISRDAKPEELREKSVIVLSVTHNLDASGGLVPAIVLDSRNGRNAAEMLRLSSRVEKFAMGPWKVSDFADRHGHVFIMELPAGSHQIDNWSIFSGAATLRPDPPPPPLIFEITKGETLYLGNFHFEMSGRWNPSGYLTIVDRRGEDFALAEVRVPSLKGRIRPALIRSGPWGLESDVSKHPAPIPLYRFIPKK